MVHRQRSGTGNPILRGRPIRVCVGCAAKYDPRYDLSAAEFLGEPTCHESAHGMRLQNDFLVIALAEAIGGQTVP